MQVCEYVYNGPAFLAWYGPPTVLLVVPSAALMEEMLQLLTLRDIRRGQPGATGLEAEGR